MGRERERKGGRIKIGLKWSNVHSLSHDKPGHLSTLVHCDSLIEYPTLSSLWRERRKKEERETDREGREGRRGGGKEIERERERENYNRNKISRYASQQ